MIVDLSKSDEDQPEISDERFQEIVNAALEDPGALNTWEYDFINNVADLEEAAELSGAQIIKLLEIAEKLDV